MDKSNKMLIDATHPEETRVVVLRNGRVEEFDYESAARKLLRGNIYLAKVTRVEPSLQAAFVDYGGNRHGFLAFNEIHPDYYRIPIVDREALQAELEAEAAANERSDEDDDEADDSVHAKTEGAERVEAEPVADDADLIDSNEGEGEGEGYARNDEAPADFESPTSYDMPDFSSDRGASEEGDDVGKRAGPDFDGETEASASEDRVEGDDRTDSDDRARSDDAMALRRSADPEGRFEGPLFEPENGANEGMGDRDAAEGMATERSESISGGNETRPDELPAAPVGGGIEDRAPVAATPLDIVGGDEAEEDDQPRRPRSLRRYKIQEVIKRRQIMLLQVTKEERGNKGAALTTYLSLAGRYCVLMPNTGRGGGISRKITNATDRKRLKSILGEFDIADGMAVIVRTAGSERNKTELRRDYEYLVRLWDEIRQLTLQSTAPNLIYEEASLIKRAIRDLYARDIEEVLVEGDDAYKAAKNFMRTLMPSHAKRVQLYKDESSHLFHRFQVESQLDAIHNPTVNLRSGGYIVINSTEALVAIDVNSGRATRERNIEETALRTNQEAADEVARQLRLRDLAGLIVIDFIDMEEHRNNAAVERRLKDAMRHDRARIQVGRISAFGLLELSRQRLRPSLIEASTEVCRHCRGSGHVRSTESTALHVLRAIEEEGIRNRSSVITATVPTVVALYILNNKRAALAELEQRHNLRLTVGSDDALIPPDHRMERSKTQVVVPEVRQPISQPDTIVEDEEIPEEEETTSPPPEAAVEATVQEPAGGHRRSRRRRRGRREDGRQPQSETASRFAQPSSDDRDSRGDSPAIDASEDEREDYVATSAPDEATGEALPGGEMRDQDGERRRRRRGRRGGR